MRQYFLVYQLVSGSVSVGVLTRHRTYVESDKNFAHDDKCTASLSIVNVYFSKGARTQSCIVVVVVIIFSPLNRLAMRANRTVRNKTHSLNR